MASLNPHTLLIVSCEDCDEIDTASHLEHAPDSKQVEGVRDACDLMVREHRDETGHEASLTVEEHDPEDAQAAYDAWVAEFENEVMADD